MPAKSLRTRSLAAAGVVVATAAGVAFAAVSDVPTANQKAAGYAAPNRLSQDLQEVVWAQGSTKLENSSDIIGWYGYEKDVASADNSSLPQMVPTPSSNTEAKKTEPDKNTYLVFDHGRAHGADSGYDYGTHFLYQGHEGVGYITRINLDADADHRVTLLAATDSAGHPLATIDGSTWDPFAKRLLFTTENSSAPTYAATPDYPSTVEDVSGALGRGGYEGIQDDSDGNIWIVEDIGGSGKDGTTAKRPNSFLYRYVPAHPGDLRHGKLEALQVKNTAGQPITFESQAAQNNPDQQLVHSYGHSLDTQWVVVHDTAVDGTASFDANAAAKAAHATPFKRPENGQFRPGSGFKQFYFDETGDTNATSPENGDPGTGAGGAGGWGAIQKLVQSSPSAPGGKLTLFFRCNEAHSGLDNTAFLSSDTITFVEDAGDTLHGQRNALDSGYVFDVTKDYSSASNQPVRWIAEGRDASATVDAANGGFGKNDQDNEITGVHVSDGDPTTGGLLGAKTPSLFQSGWRWFWTQQHGDNVTYEVLGSPGRG